jgi:hypothetical protein
VAVFGSITQALSGNKGSGMLKSMFTRVRLE